MEEVQFLSAKARNLTIYQSQLSSFYLSVSILSLTAVSLKIRQLAGLISMIMLLCQYERTAACLCFTNVRGSCFPIGLDEGETKAQKANNKKTDSRVCPRTFRPPLAEEFFNSLSFRFQIHWGLSNTETSIQWQAVWKNTNIMSSYISTKGIVFQEKDVKKCAHTRGQQMHHLDVFLYKYE